MVIDRAFFRLDAGLVHYREAGQSFAGNGRTIVLAHGGPGSSKALVPLITELAQHSHVIAPDMMGNGDSDPPPSNPSIGFYAQCLIALLDGLGIEIFDLYGHHTGAQVATEVAIAIPQRVHRLALDGVGLFDTSLRADLLDNYAAPIKPEIEGTHIAKIWDFASHMTRYFPHYRRDDMHRLDPGVILQADAVMDIVSEIVKAWPTVHLAYRASFEHILQSRLPLVPLPTLVLATDGDPLARYAPEAAVLLSDGRSLTTSRSGRAASIKQWFAA